MPNPGEELKSLVESSTSSLLAITDQASAIRPLDDKWSPREVLGHLIDSASNNHQRFVRAQLEDDLVFAGYDQARWVEVQCYRDRPWQELVMFWRSFNLHLSRVIELIPDEALHRSRAKHNLDQIAWKSVPKETSTTLDYFVRDYIVHLKHHLGEIL